VCADPERAFARILQQRSAMSLLTVVFVIVVVGVLLWVVNRFIPMDSKIRSILNAVVVIILVLWLLNVFGVLGSLQNIRV
jgi:low affinity Fe/Cu permease